LLSDRVQHHGLCVRALYVEPTDMNTEEAEVLLATVASSLATVASSFM
jgi:hypothetical protein